MSVFFCVGAIGQQQTNAFVGCNRADTSQVSETAIDGSEVELEIAGVQDHTLRSVECRCDSVRHRVRNGNELDVERTDHSAFAVDNRNEFGAVKEAGFLDAIPGKTKSECRSVNRKLKFAQQERQTAGVIFVTMGGNATNDAVGVFAQVSEIGKYEIDPEHVEIREHQPAVKEKDLPFQFDTCAVPSNFAKTAEEGDRNWRSLRIANLRRLY